MVTTLTIPADRVEISTTLPWMKTLINKARLQFIYKTAVSMKATLMTKCKPRLVDQLAKDRDRCQRGVALDAETFLTRGQTLNEP